MKIKKWVSVILTALFIVSSSTLCFADVKLKTTETHAIFDVQLGDEYAGENFVVEIFYPNKDVSDIVSLDTESLMSVLGVVYQEQLDAQGNCKVELVPGNAEGIYTARVATETMRTVKTIQFPFTPANSISLLIDELKVLDPTQQTSLQRIESIFVPKTDGMLSDHEKLGLSELSAFTLFLDENRCSTVAKQAIYQFILNRISTINNKEDFQILFANAVSVETILHTPAAKIPTLLKEVAVDCDLTSSKLYNEIYLNDQYVDDECKQEIAKALLKYFTLASNATEEEKVQNDKAKDSFSDIIDELTFLAAISDIESNGEAGIIIDVGEELLTKHGVDMSDYKDLETPAEVWRELDGNYDSLESFISDFEDKVAEQKQAEEGGSGGSSGSSGGSGGSGGLGGSRGSGGSGLKVDRDLITTSTPEPVEFSDIASVPWAEEGIYYLAEKGIINGKAEGVFDPNAYMKREEFAKILVLALGLYDDTATTSFSDVSAEDWFYSFVAAGEKAGLIKGSDGRFGVGDPISREDVAVLLSRGAAILEKTLEVKNEAISFVDYDEISEYAVSAVEELSQAGIINGIGEQRFAPKNYATRAEIAKMIYIFLKG